MGISYIEINEQKIPIEDEGVREVVTNMQGEIDLLNDTIDEELGNVEYWVPKGTIHNPERNYYIKTKNTLKVWYQIELTSELNSTNSVFNLCDNICSTFGLKSHLNAWNISYCLNYTALPYRYYTITGNANNNILSVGYNGTAVPAGTNVYGYLEFAIDVQ